MARDARWCACGNRHGYRSAAHNGSPEDLKTIQELVRHSSIYVTMNTYAHVMPAVKRGAVDKLGGIIDRSVDIG